LREARVAHAFVHPRAVILRDFGVTEDDRPYLTMDLCPGRPLSAILEEVGRLPPRRAVHIAAQVAEVLHEAHAHGILHRDIKPDNIMVDDSEEQDQVKVMDFGIAKMMAGDSRDTDLTRGNAIGTPLYMSPEQAAGEPIDGRSDLYSLGVVLYQCVAGQPPFSAESVHALLMKHLTQPPPPLPDDMPDLADGRLEAILNKALAKDPADRFPSAGVMLEALRAFLDHDDTTLERAVGKTVREDSTAAATRTPIHRPATWSPGEIRVTGHSGSLDSGEYDQVPPTLAAIRPVEETPDRTDGTGSPPPLVSRVSPALEVADTLSGLEKRGGGSAGGAIAETESRPGSGGGLADPAELEAERGLVREEQEKGGAGADSECETPSRDNQEPDETLRKSARPRVRRWLAVALLLLLLGWSVVGLARWAVAGLLPGAFQTVLEENPGLATALDNLLALGFLGPGKADRDDSLPGAPTSTGTAAPSSDRSGEETDVAAHRTSGSSGSEPTPVSGPAAGRDERSATRTRRKDGPSAVPVAHASSSKHKPIVIDTDKAGREVVVGGREVILEGRFPGEIHRVEVQGREVSVQDGRFEAPLQLPEGATRVTITGFGRTLSETRVLDVVVDTRPPRLVLERPANGIYLRLPRVPVTGTLEEPNLEDVRVNGRPVRVRGKRVLGSCPLKPGKNVVEVVATDRAGNRTVERRVVYFNTSRTAP